MKLYEPPPNEFERSIYDEDQEINSVKASTPDEPDFWLFV
jgi:hypothetical protein